MSDLKLIASTEKGSAVVGITSITPAPNPQGLGFFDFPLEIRSMIYNALLDEAFHNVLPQMDDALYVTSLFILSFGDDAVSVPALRHVLSRFQQKFIHWQWLVA